MLDIQQIENLNTTEWEHKVSSSDSNVLTSPRLEIWQNFKSFSQVKKNQLYNAKSTSRKIIISEAGTEYDWGMTSSWIITGGF